MVEKEKKKKRKKRRSTVDDVEVKMNLGSTIIHYLLVGI